MERYFLHAIGLRDIHRVHTMYMGFFVKKRLVPSNSKFKTWQYGVGFVVSTAVLHGIGLLLGGRLHQQGLWLRATGALVAASGACMMAAT